MLTIKLQRLGRKKLATYRLIVVEKGRDTQGNSLEIVGTYNPHNEATGFAPQIDRVKYWLSKGAQASPTIHNLLVKAGIIEGQKKKSVFLSKKRQTKLATKKKEAEDKVIAAQQAAEAAKAVETPVPAETPAETVVETPAEVQPVAETPVTEPVTEPVAEITTEEKKD